MEQNNHDWSKFSKKINIKAEVQDIYNAWAYQENIEKWFLSSAIFSTSGGAVKNKTDIIQKDDTYAWEWYGSDIVEKGKVIDVNRIDKIQFTFFNCLVTVTIKTIGSESMVELWQENIPLDEMSKVNLHLGCTRGWTFYLANLKSILEGGIDLRNKNEKLSGVINT